MKKKLLFCACLALPGFAQAEASCEERLDHWAEQLVPGRAYDRYNASCKPWLANPALTLAAIPFPQDDSDFQRAVQDLLVVVADSESGEVKAHVLHQAALKNIPVHDSLLLMQTLDFDMARYQLTPDRRAFGVRAVHENHWASTAASVTLNLYVIEGVTLRPVLTQMLVATNYADWDGRCSGTFHDMRRAVRLGAPGKDGYAALLVTEQAKFTESTGSEDDCKHKSGPVKRAKYLIRYAGGEYVLPKGLSNGD